MASVTLTFSNITNNGKPCKDPIILIHGSENVAFPCGDKVDENGQIKLTVPDSLFGERQCITGVIKCAECDACKEEDFEICICDDKYDCKACSECVNGICVDKCPDKKCIDGTCVDCENDLDCPKGFICVNGKCVCVGKVNSAGECVECIDGKDCGLCSECRNGKCEPTICPNNLVCLNGECGCPPGTKYNSATQKCDPIDCVDNSQCAACEICVGGECRPIVCPDGYKCIDGECKPWPCKDVKCSNGADCGEGCGCVNGECIPCYLLNCDTTADVTPYPACAGALGCQCNGLKCEPVDNCGQYCDGSTPCLDTNCTCYNNECVSCKNFPCNPDECSDKYNCGCVGGECNGGGDGGCNDSLKLTKESVCNDNGCEVVAKFTSEKGCKCDPIEFRVKHKSLTSGPNTGDTGVAQASDNILNLAVALYKNNKPYANFLNDITMGDDELVSATIQTVITHKVNNVVVNPPVTPVGVVIVDGANKVADIKIGTTNIATTFNQSGTKVTVQLRAVGLKVPNNGCVSYEDSVIAEYELDYTSNSASQVTQNRINGEYSTDLSKKINDNTSARVPLFVWSKSNSSSFSNNKFNNTSGVYAQSGWFRKEYGQFANGAWTDKINNPSKATAGNQNNELWNNYNYRVTVDCGCKQNFDTLQNLVFCCTDKVLPVLTNCNRTLNIDKFSVCSVNSYLGASTSGYSIPKEAQTYFWLVINNGEYEKKLRNEGGNLTAPMTPYTHNKPITSLRIEQRYEGTPLVPVACEKEYTYESVSPDYDLTKECGKIVVKNRPGNPAILSVKVKEGTTDYPFTPSQSNAVWTLENNILKKDGTFSIEVSFQGGCLRVEDVVIDCEPDIETGPEPDIYAFSECGGDNPNIKVSTKQGFSSLVKFAISTDPNNFVSGTLNTTTNQYQYTFTNGGNGFPAGTYTVTAKEGTKIKTATVEVKAPKKPEVTVTDICLTSQGLIKLTNLVPGSKWSVSGPTGAVPLAYSGAQQTADANGKIEIGVPVGKQGEYTITFVSDPPNSTEKTCPQVLKPKVNTGGQVSPKIILLQGGQQVTVGLTVGMQIEACEGESIQFRIDDGGKNLTYELFTNAGDLAGAVTTATASGGTSISTLKASTQDSPNWAYYNVPVSINTIPENSTYTSRMTVSNAIDKGCNTIVSTLLNVIVKPTPKVINVIHSCVPNQPNQYLYNLEVVTNYQNVTVKVTGQTGAVTLNYIGTSVGGQFRFTNPANSPIQGPGITTEIYFPQGCSVKKSQNLPSCSPGQACPPPESVDILIAATPESPTCSNNENVQLAFQYATGLGSLTGKQYTWYVGSNNNFVPAAIVGDPNPGTVGPNNSIPVLDTVSQPSTEQYKLTISEGGSCDYDSNIIQVYSLGTPISADITGPGAQGDPTPILTNTTYNYSVNAVPNATYAWTLSNSNGSNQSIGSNSNTVQISNFVSGPNIIGVTITTPNGCSESGTATVNVSGNCSGVLVTTALKSPLNPTCSNVEGTVGPIPSGYNVVSYEWRVSYNGGSTYTAVQSGTSLPIADLDTSIIPAGQLNAKIVLRVELGGIGSCPPIDSAALNYSRCANGCTCTYNLSAVDSSSGLNPLSTWVVVYGSNNTELVASVRKLVTKQCSDLPSATIVNVVENSGLKRTNFNLTTTSFTNNTFTSMDIVSAGVPGSLAIPTSFNGGNPQTNIVKLVEFLNANVVGATFYNNGGVPAHYILQTNTGGFDVNGQYTLNGSPYDYFVAASGQLFNQHSYSTPCGQITHTKNYDDIPSGGEFVTSPTPNYNATYNSLTYLGSTTSTPTANRPGHAPTTTCNGCN